MERSFWTGDVEFYRSTLAPDCRMIVPGVGAMSCEEVIQGIAGGERWDQVEMSKIEVQELSADVAVLSYEACATRSNIDAPYRAFVSSVYAMRNGVWALAFHQQTIAE